MNKNTWLLLASVVTGAAVTTWFAGSIQRGPVFGAFDVGRESFGTFGPVLIGLYGFFCTLAGVTLGVAYRRLIELRDSGRRTVRNRELVDYLLRSIEFKLGLVGAPIVFGLIWRQLSEIPLEVYTIIALENGFVSNAILSQFASGHAGTATVSEDLVSRGGDGGRSAHHPPTTE